MARGISDAKKQGIKNNIKTIKELLGGLEKNMDNFDECKKFISGIENSITRIKVLSNPNSPNLAQPKQDYSML